MVWYLDGSPVLGLYLITQTLDVGLWTPSQSSIVNRQSSLLRVYHLDTRRNLFLRNQCWPVRNDLLNFGPTSGKSCHGGRASQNQWRDLFGKSLDCFAIITADTNA